MKLHKAISLPLVILVLTLVKGASAQSPDSPIVLGTKEAPPFAMQQPDGSWRGLSIDLWRRIADQREWTYQIRETDLEGLLSGVAAGSLDVAVAALTITAQREERMDFTHPFHVSGLGIAVRSGEQHGWQGAVRGLFSWRLAQAVGALAVLLLIVGVLVWLFERRRNKEQFGGSPARGIASGFWWSAVTMTTVGYGDKAPQTLGGRIVGLIWMFAAIILISSFTAAIASALTAAQFEAPVQGPGDLDGAEVGTVSASTSARYLMKRRIAARSYANVPQALEALREGEIEAFVYDAPLLQYRINEEYAGDLRVLPPTFQTQYYAFALPPESPLRDSLNQTLIAQIEQPAWKDLRYQYLGE